jgi:SWI/SNF-related matrix-associated actin-dependent regulator 1 of chromatin subfamily A
MNQEEKQSSVEKFQEDKNICLFSGMIGASGVGITLTEASKLIFLGFAWTPADMEQAEDRIHRATTTHDNIQIIQYICVDTIDEDINELLKEKSQVVSKVLDNKDFNKRINVSHESIFKSLLERLK